MIFQESENFHLTQRYRNRTMIVYTIFKFTIEMLKITARKFMTSFVNKIICFLSFLFDKNDKNTRILHSVQLYRFIENEPNVVIFIARRAVCLAERTTSSGRE